MIGIEQVVEPDGRFFFKGDRFAICDGVPGIVALLFPVDQAIAEGADLILLKEGKDGEIVRSSSKNKEFAA